VKRFWRKRRVRTLPEIGELPLTPLIDTAFTLLIIFMVTAPMMQNSLKINLPKAKSGAPSQSQTIERLIVSIDGKGKIFVGDHEVSGLTALAADLKTKIAKSYDKTVLVKADKALTYEKVISVIDLVSGVDGVENVSLAAELATKRS
jgi:biopolymer transport protein ExbD